MQLTGCHRFRPQTTYGACGQPAQRDSAGQWCSWQPRGDAAAWWMARPIAPSMVAMVMSTTPARKLRDLAGSIRDDGRPYRISVQV